MAEWSDPRVTQNHAGVTIDGKPVASTAVDAGLRAHMLKVYNYMTSGVLLTGIVALLFANSGMAAQVMATPLRWLIILSPLAFIMVMSFGINKLSTGALQAMFWAFAAVMGLSMSTIFLVYSGESIARTFFVTAAAFASLSLWGYTTKRDLSGFGVFLFMGLLGIIIASIVNIFMKSDMMEFIISIAGVVIFAGLTAFDTQKLKYQYYQLGGDSRSMAVATNYGALNLYLDFINLFQFIMSLLSRR